MGLKDAFDNISKTVSNAVDNAKDAASEAGHRTEAQTEQAKRDVAGDSMSVGDKTKSVLNQTKEETLANVDTAKQDIRNNT